MNLLDHKSIVYVNAGVVGLRESGSRNALAHLPRIKDAHRLHPELGSFDDEVMLLLDTYPDVNWDLLVGEYVLDEQSKAAGRLPSRQHLLGNDDLRCVRDESWFAELLSAARDEAGGDQRLQHATVVPALQADNR